MQAGQLFAVRTNPATQFIAGLAQNAALTLNLAQAAAGQTPGDGYIDGALAAGSSVRMRLRSMLIQSVQPLDWEIWLWASAQFAASLTNPALNHPLGINRFASTDGHQLAGAGLYYYYMDGLDQPYEDEDNTGQLHVMLVNRNATAKQAGTSGAILLQLNFEPTLGW